MLLAVLTHHTALHVFPALTSTLIICVVVNAVSSCGEYPSGRIYVCGWATLGRVQEEKLHAVYERGVLEELLVFLGRRGLQSEGRGFTHSC